MRYEMHNKENKNDNSYRITNLIKSITEFENINTPLIQNTKS